MFESASPDTFSYLILGLVVVSTIIVLFVGSIVVRTRNLQKDLEMIDHLQNDK